MSNFVIKFKQCKLYLSSKNTVTDLINQALKFADIHSAETFLQELCNLDKSLVFTDWLIKEEIQ